MPDAVPSPLREQIAHATRDALSEANRMDEALAPRPSDPPLLDRQTRAVADAVLPLVEAERVAEREAALARERERLDRMAEEERGYAAGAVAAERLRLHTQLRYRRDAAMRNAQDVADERGSRAELGYFQTLAEAYDNAIGLLGVAATPQPEETTP